MKTENQLSKIKPADRLASVSEYYFSKKLKEVAQMNAEGKDVISLGIGSPDMPPSESTIQTLCDAAATPTDMATSLMWVFPNCAVALPAGIRDGTA